MRRKISENATIPFPAVALSDNPMKHRKNFIDDFIVKKDDMLMDKPHEPYDLPMEDVEKIKILLGQYLTLFKDREDKIKVLKRGQTDSGVLYDLYLDEFHAILYIKPEEKVIGLVNRTMDKDDFADVLEDMEEINTEPDKRKLGKMLIGIGRAEFKPKIEIEEPEEEIETDTEEVQSELDKKMEDNVEKEEATEEVPTEDVPTPEPEEATDEPEESVLPTEDEEEKEKDDSKIKKENVQIGRNNMKKVKDILNEYGFKRIVDKNDVISIVEYYQNNSLKDFSSFIVKIKGNDYDEIYGVCGSRFDEEKEVIQVVKGGKLIYETSKKNDLYTERYETGEIVKIDLSRVDGEYVKQIFTLSKRTKGYAMVESVEGDIVRIVENEHKAKIKQSVPINKSALIKIDTIRDSCVVYEDKEAVAEYKSLLNEAKTLSEKNKNNKKENESVEISEDIMNASFGINRKKK